MLTPAPEREETEITPEMIAAGAAAIGLYFEEAGVSRYPLRRAAEDCFRAMLAARPQRDLDAKPLKVVD
jgi:hypothetical protein